MREYKTQNPPPQVTAKTRYSRYISEKEIEANKIRNRDRYRNNPEYRERQKARMRELYQQRKNDKEYIIHRNELRRQLYMRKKYGINTNSNNNKQCRTSSSA